MEIQDYVNQSVDTEKKECTYSVPVILRNFVPKNLIIFCKIYKRSFACAKP